MEGDDDMEMGDLGNRAEAARQIQQDTEDTADMGLFDPVDIPDVDLGDQTTSFIDDPGARPKELPPPLDDTRIRERTRLIRTKVNNFYDTVIRENRLAPDGGFIDYTNFDVKGNKLFVETEKGLVQLTQNKDPTKFYSLSTLEKKIGTTGIRELFNIPDYKKLTQAERDAAENVENIIPDNFENILLNDLPKVTNDVLHSLEETFNTFRTDGTQTDLTTTEMEAIEKSMTSLRDELGSNLSKLSQVEEEIGKEKEKLEQAQKDKDNYQIMRINDRIRDYETERAARMEVINENKEGLRSQFNRIKETFQKILHEDKNLMERVKTLFKEQGVTIATILTAIGMAIAAIVEAVLPKGTTTGTDPTPKPSDPTNAKDWIKKQLTNLGKLLAKLAGKAASALPGILGAIVSWLLSATGTVVNWLANNLWALLVFVAGLLLMAARKYIYKK